KYRTRPPQRSTRRLSPIKLGADADSPRAVRPFSSDLQSHVSSLQPHLLPMSSFEQFIETFLHNFADLRDVESATRVGCRLLLAAFLGGCIGYNRERAGKAAGLRTH